MLGVSRAALLGAAKLDVAAPGLTRPTPTLAAGQDELPGSNLVYVAPDGADSTGDGSPGSPYATLEKAHDHSGLGAGWTIVVRGGTYDRTQAFAPSKSGSAGNPITVMAYPGETVILDRWPEFAAFRTPGQGLWELHDASLNVWRSTSTGFSSGRLQGVWDEGGQSYQLWGYLSDGAWGTSSAYFGPMVRAQSDGRVYIRFQKPLASYTGTGWPGYVDGVSGGVFNVPGSQNPNDYPIFLYRRGNAAAATAVYRFDGKSHWAIKDINIYGTDVGAALQNTCTGITFRRGLWKALRYGTRVLDSATCDGIAWLGLQKLHGAINHWRWHWIKNSEASGDQDNNGAFNIRTGTNSNFTIEDCVIYNFFDCFIGQNTPSNWIVRYNWFDNVRDDVFQMSQDTDGFELAYNVFYNSPFWCTNLTGSGGTGNDYLHHNVAWQLWPAFWNSGARPGCNKLLITHGSSPQNQPQKIFNNTLICNSCAATRYTAALGHCQGRKANTLSTAHEVLNNLIMILADEVWLNGEGGHSEHDHTITRTRTDSNDVIDHNHYAKIVAYGSMLSSLIGPTEVGASSFYSSTAAFFSNDGFEENGTAEQATSADVATDSPLADPFNLDFRPRAGSALLSGAKDLSATGWPGASNAAWRGALDPAGNGTEIGPRAQA